MSVACLIILVLHFSMVVLYANPFATAQPAVARRYVYPFFMQGWGLFVPCPVSNYRLFVDFKCGEKRIRYDLFEALVREHAANRLSGTEGLVTVFAGSIHYFEHATSLREKLNGPIRNDLYFSMLEHSTRRYLQNIYGCEPLQLKIMLLVIPRQGAQRVYFN